MYIRGFDFEKLISGYSSSTLSGGISVTTYGGTKQKINGKT